jgi:two-component system OmpR family response regulator/two-component system response regulator CpxR
MPETDPRKRILVVDDEPALLKLLERYLTRSGYRVEACGSAEQALERYGADPGVYSLVIADLQMPGMSGEELLEMLIRRNPSIRIVVCSGHPFEHLERRLGTEGQIRFVQKPFLPSMLDSAIRGLLGGS